MSPMVSKSIMALKHLSPCWSLLWDSTTLFSLSNMLRKCALFSVFLWCVKTEDIWCVGLTDQSQKHRWLFLWFWCGCNNLWSVWTLCFSCSPLVFCGGKVIGDFGSWSTWWPRTSWAVSHCLQQWCFNGKCEVTQVILVMEGSDCCGSDSQTRDQSTTSSTSWATSKIEFVLRLQLLSDARLPVWRSSTEPLYKSVERCYYIWMFEALKVTL